MAASVLLPTAILALSWPASAATHSTNGGLSLALPPGWTAKAPDPARPHDLFVLVGPERHSCVLTAISGRIDFYNRAAVEAQMWTIVMRVNRAANLRMMPVGRLRTAALANGAVVDYLMASQAGHPPLLAGLCRFQDRVLLITLVSADPENMVRTIAGTLVKGVPLAEEETGGFDRNAAARPEAPPSAWPQYLIGVVGTLLAVYGTGLLIQFLRARRAARRE